MTTALILGRSNGVGLDRDAALVAGALRTCGVQAKTPRLRSIAALLSGENRADWAFHLERFAPWWKWKAKTHFLIPNQERFPGRLLPRLKNVDHVLCKSRHAEEIFSRHHPSVHFIGFSSVDRLLPEVPPDYGKFFHLAGRSTLKNTETLLALWARHSEWPELTLVQHPDNAPAEVPENVRLMRDHLPDPALRLLQNECGIHLCPSLSEGWGHYIVEAMSCRAVTVTTDGPPMNELVGDNRGILIPVGKSEPRHLGRNFHVDPAALEAAIGELISSPPEKMEMLGAAGRQWFEENAAAFPKRFAQTVMEITAR